MTPTEAKQRHGDPSTPLPHPILIAGEIYRNSTYGGKHPLAIPRVSVALDLIRNLDWVSDETYIDSPVASKEQLARFHDPAYIDAVWRAQQAGDLLDYEKDLYNLGRNGNPIYKEVFTRPATAAGAAVLAGSLLAGGGVIYSLASGTHHGRKAQANGFCFFNDVVLGIQSLLDNGCERVYYVDIDVHHGDGVELAFADDDRVLTLSVHEEGLWPGTGALTDIGNGFSRNLPVPRGMGDAEMAFILDELILPIGDAFSPDAVVLQAGCDALADDPLGRQKLSNSALWNVARQVTSLSPRTLVTGGGGYNPYAVGRCWAGIWGTLNNFDIPDYLPDIAQYNLRAIPWSHSRARNAPEAWFTRLIDSPNPLKIRTDIRDRISKLRAFGV